MALDFVDTGFLVEILVNPMVVPGKPMVFPSLFVVNWGFKNPETKSVVPGAVNHEHLQRCEKTFERPQGTCSWESFRGSLTSF